MKLSLFYKISPFGAHTWATIFGNLKHLLVQKKIELLDDSTLIPQFRNLREEKTERGQIDIRPIGRARDDLAVAVALAANELTKEVLASAPFELGIVEGYKPGFHKISGSCELEAICLNFPRFLA